MARLRKSTSEWIEDYFADMPAGEQARMLERLELIQRLTQRRECSEPEEEGKTLRRWKPRIILDPPEEEAENVPVL